MPASDKNSKLITIDGSFGEGGGQILRTSLALSLITGRPLALEQIRAKRAKPGLQPQHLAAVRAAAKVGQAQVEGDSVGSKRLVFRPGAVQGGEYEFRIGTAGSTTLVLQTVLPALLCAESQSTLNLVGGTHNPFAPPFDFLAKSYLPLVSRMGPNVQAVLSRAGFYPAGHGSFQAVIQPAKSLGPLVLLERGVLRSRSVRILLSNLPRHIAQREQAAIAAETGWPNAAFELDFCAGSVGPGNAVLIDLEYENVTEVVCSFGRKGVPAETVALEAVQAARTYEESGVPVGEHLADQLLLPLALGAHQGTGGGAFRTGPLSSHSETHIDVLQRFLDARIDVEQVGQSNCVVRVDPPAAERMC